MKFADPSEYGYGVGVLSQSRYGSSFQGNPAMCCRFRSSASQLAATAPGAEQLCCDFMRFLEGHASVGLQINVGRVVSAYETNLLEDDAGAERLTRERQPARGMDTHSLRRQCRSGLRSADLKSRPLNLCYRRKGEEGIGLR